MRLASEKPCGLASSTRRLSQALVLLKERLCPLAEDSWKSPGAQPISQVEAHRQQGESDPGMVIARAARLRHGGDNISPLKTAWEQPNCSGRRKKTRAPGAALALR